MKKLNEQELMTIVGGKKGFNAGKCALGTLGGAAGGILTKSRFGMPGMVLGGIIGGASGAVRSCM
ncbi:Blp family class II bacteriocin [Lactobacillus johnsonii]|uniref:Blp family class II bacteriocin n=1 Tax=Lactobacillus johnsonii TaxID=33959 RepID=UPI0028E261CE|nr:Blp family class II bacteriocin [Lactobacillus johnsonii]MDT9605025.1 Blp family class II bacteriocin [Lactobacillus johnsonii]